MKMLNKWNDKRNLYSVLIHGKRFFYRWITVLKTLCWDFNILPWLLLSLDDAEAAGDDPADELGWSKNDASWLGSPPADDEALDPPPSIPCAVIESSLVLSSLMSSDSWMTSKCRFSSNSCSISSSVKPYFRAHNSSLSLSTLFMLVSSSTLLSSTMSLRRRFSRDRFAARLFFRRLSQ